MALPSAPHLTQLLLIFAAAFCPIAAGVKCFCDRSSCQDALICSGDYCVIGVRKDGDATVLHQLCAEADGSKGRNNCERLVDSWQEVGDL
ncbi:unnamed protein product, partial [Mesorhabditis spiculigera]